MIPFLEAIERGGVVGDGAMGSALYERGVFTNRSFDEVNLSQPELVQKVHRDYLLAGAQVLETNTYGSNRIRLSKYGLADQCTRIIEAATKIARQASEGAAYVAGAMGPTGLTPGEVRRQERDIRAAYKEQAYLLAEGGADLIIIETFSNPAEIRLAIEAARDQVSLPIVAQVTVDEEGCASDGTCAEVLAYELRDWGADVVGANCNGPGVIFNAVEGMLKAGIPVCAMPNAGRPQKVEDRLIYVATPENFGVYARRMFKAGVKFVGGCCGTNSEHIARVASAARMVAPRQDQLPPQLKLKTEGKAPAPIEERSHLGKKLGKQFVVSVEVNPQQGLSQDKSLAAAKMLYSAGADVINIADGPRASARMGNLALAQMMQSQTQGEVLLHVCCRDRNLLALQAHLLAAHASDIRNLIIITGDPPKIGDFPDATAVYDVDSIGLLRIAHGLNRGVDASGKDLGDQTKFVLITGVEPAAADFEREMLRLKQKVDAGAEAIMTQPIYDPKHLERFLEASQDLDVPVLVGILPLASSRNAEFIHTNIPGMQIPENVRERMRKAGKGEEARRVGIEIAVESLMGVRDRVAGAYIMPPLGRYEMAAAIIEQLKDRSIAKGVPGAR